MYTRYKSRKRNRNVFKLLFLMALFAGAIYLGYHFRGYLLFWKYSYSKLEKKLMAIEAASPQLRGDMLAELAKISDDYKKDNQLSADAYFASGQVHFMLGEYRLKGGFSDFIIQEKNAELDQKTRKEFITAIRDTRKGMALAGGDGKNIHYLILAKAAYYTRFYSLEAIQDLINKIKNPDSITRKDDIRFIAVINILNNKTDEGIDFLKKHEQAVSDVEDALFLASVDRLGKRYTNAIVGFKQVIEKSTDSGMLKQAHLNLGKIYFTQGLFTESVDHFKKALDIDQADQSARIWIGKGYYSMGDKASAKKIWGEALAADQGNEELKKLISAP